MFMIDCAYLYIMILDEILAEGGDYRDGRLIHERAKNKQFDGKVRIYDIFPYLLFY